MSNLDLYSYVWNEKGEHRSYNEDRKVVDLFFMSKGTNDSVSNLKANFDVSLFAIFDGHGGKDVARYLLANFPDALKKNLLKITDESSLPEKIAHVLRQTFLQVNADIEKIHDDDIAEMERDKTNDVSESDNADAPDSSESEENSDEKGQNEDSLPKSTAVSQNQQQPQQQTTSQSVSNLTKTKTTTADGGDDDDNDNSNVDPNKLEYPKKKRAKIGAKMHSKYQFIRTGSTAEVLLIVNRSFYVSSNCGDTECILFQNQEQVKAERDAQQNLVLPLIEEQQRKNNLEIAIVAKDLMENEELLESHQSLFAVSNGEVTLLTALHHPAEDGERIRRLGGNIYYGRVNGNLAVTRSFGDFELVGETNRKLITAEPFIAHGAIANGDIFVIASDGLWDVYNKNVVATIAFDVVLKNKTVHEEKNVAKILVENALRRGSTDNTTAIVVSIQEKIVFS